MHTYEFTEGNFKYDLKYPSMYDDSAQYELYFESINYDNIGIKDAMLVIYLCPSIVANSPRLANDKRTCMINHPRDELTAGDLLYSGTIKNIKRTNPKIAVYGIRADAKITVTLNWRLPIVDCQSAT